MELKTSDEWFKLFPEEYNLKIIDPDGWDRTNFQYSFYEEKISEKEFKTRLMSSTLQCNTKFFSHINLN